LIMMQTEMHLLQSALKQQPQEKEEAFAIEENPCKRGAVRECTSSSEHADGELSSHVENDAEWSGETARQRQRRGAEKRRSVGGGRCVELSGPPGEPCVAPSHELREAHRATLGRQQLPGTSR